MIADWKGLKDFADFYSGLRIFKEDRFSQILYKFQFALHITDHH